MTPAGGEGSMTACGPTQRTPTKTVRPARLLIWILRAEPVSAGMRPEIGPRLLPCAVAETVPRLEPRLPPWTQPVLDCTSRDLIRQYVVVTISLSHHRL